MLLLDGVAVRGDVSCERTKKKDYLYLTDIESFVRCWRKFIAPSWSDTVLFFAHDEGGGTFDHVPPLSMPSLDGIKLVDLMSIDAPRDFTITASRVPNIVISPFTKKIRFTHANGLHILLGVPTPTARDAVMPDMTEFSISPASPGQHRPHRRRRT